MLIYVEVDMDSIFKALSDKNRRKILGLLKKKDMSVKELQQYFDITQASMSHHLDILKRANLVIDERKGQFVFYSVNMSVAEEAINYFMNMFNGGRKAK